jgi:hypothetical protein
MAADGRLLLDQKDLVAGVGEIERCLHAGDATAHDHDGTDYGVVHTRRAVLGGPQRAEFRSARLLVEDGHCSLDPPGGRLHREPASPNASSSTPVVVSAPEAVKKPCKVAAIAVEVLERAQRAQEPRKAL